MLNINMFDLIKGFSQVIDLVNTTLASHHQRTAVIVDQICIRLGLPERARALAVMSAMLHDVGVIPLRDRTDNLIFEKDMARHSQAGYLLLRSCPILADQAKVILYHHTSWEGVSNLPEQERPLAAIGNIIHLADALDIQTRLKPGDRQALANLATKGQGRIYEKKAAQAALDFINEAAFEDYLENAHHILTLKPAPELNLTGEEVTVFSSLFSHVIDSRSHFTATHSTGVAWIARGLHGLAGLEEKNLSAIFVAGLLHDIGKLGVPGELIEKPGALSDHEFQKVRDHAQLSAMILSAIPGFEDKVAPWGSRHHEKLNGQGYPLGLKGAELSTECRLMTVADVMCALTEDRPYRPGLVEGEVITILDNMVAQGAIDGDLVELVHRHYSQVNEMRQKAQQEADDFFHRLSDDIHLASPFPRATLY